MSEKSEKNLAAGAAWPKGVSENPSGKPSRLTKMGEEFMREMFKPVEPHFADSHFLGSQLGFRSAGNTRLSNALADHETNEASAKLSKYQQKFSDSFAAHKHSSLQCLSRS